MLVYNTMTREKEEFHPITPGKAGIYTCGPTVYNYAHIGNMRAYIFMDTLRRVLEFAGYQPTHVMNITDVGHLVSDGDDGEDKMEKSARERKISPWQIAEEITAAFNRDLADLNIKTPDIVCKATEHIGEMIESVEMLCERGYGYETSDSIYFDISQFPDYGKLSRLNLEEQQAGARIEVNSEKRHPADFAIWKKAPANHIMQWPSPWGQGYPGWHIECTAMSRKYLGELFDIHTGGADHIPVHHENEIAQAYGLLGHNPANYWMHNEFMLVDGGKMSKSLGNVYTISDLAGKGYSAIHFRYFCAGAHYRSKLNFTWESLAAAKTSYDRLLALVNAHKNGDSEPDDGVIDNYKEKMREAVLDDLNVPKAIGALWGLVKLPQSRKVYDTIIEIDRVLGLRLDTEVEEISDTLEDELQVIFDERVRARAEKDYKKSDSLRAELLARGIEVLDTKEGTTWKRC